MNKTFEYKLMIKESHLDSFGHVNNARYFDLYEEARWDFITRFGYGLKEVISKQMGPVILDVNCRFKRELKNRETITITSKTVDSSGKIMKIYQEMIKEDGTIASDATFTIGFMDLKARKLINPPSEWLAAIGID
jgi:acyl-CoA thioester hydrolase